MTMGRADSRRDVWLEQDAATSRVVAFAIITRIVGTTQSAFCIVLMQTVSRNFYTQITPKMVPAEEKP